MAQGWLRDKKLVFKPHGTEFNTTAWSLGQRFLLPPWARLTTNLDAFDFPLLRGLAKHTGKNK